MILTKEIIRNLIREEVENSKLMFQNAYSLILRNLMIALIILIPLTLLLNRDLPMTLLFLIGFVFNEMIHIALAYFQADGNFVTTSKQIIVRTVLYGFGAWFIVINGLQIIWVVIYQSVILFVFFLVAHFSIPKTEIIKDKDQEKSIKIALNKAKKYFKQL